MRKNGFLVFTTCCAILLTATSCQKVKGIFGKRNPPQPAGLIMTAKTEVLNTRKAKTRKQVPGWFLFREVLL